MAGYKHLEIVQDFERYVKDKKVSARAYYRYLLTRLLRMFQYKNLPDTIPHEILDRYLFKFGIACITEVDGKLYCFSGNLGGPQDVYYRPTEFIISNPHIKTADGQLFTANIPVFTDFTSTPLGQPTSETGDEPIRQDGVLLRNDTEWLGLHPLLSRYAYLMAENTLTLRTADVMLRVIALITAKTDKEQASAIEYIKSLEKGELSIMGESPFFEGINLQSPPSQNGSYLTQFIEYQQYLKGSFFGDIGLSANYNMKREAIGKGESTLDQDALLPLAENMLKCRQEDLAKVNSMYNLDISVQFSSSWLTNFIETISTLQSMGQPTAPSFGGGAVGDGATNSSGLNSLEDEEDSDNTSGEPIESGDGVEKEVVNESENKSENESEKSSEQTSEDGVDIMTPPETDNSESKINDISIDKEFTEILEDKLSDKENVELVNPLERSEEDAESDEESSESEGSISDN